MRAFLRRHRHRIAFGLIAVMLAATVAYRLLPDHPLDSWHDGIERVLDWVREAPFPLFILLTGLLPLTGIPVTALYIIAGAVYSPVYGIPATLGGLCLGLLLNLLVSYYAARWFRGPVDRLLRRFGATLPTFSGMQPWKVVLLVRITPGAPLMVQNFLLGMAHMPLGTYLVVSMLAELLIAGGYMTAGRSFSTGRWGMLPAGIGLVVAALLIASLLRDRLRAKKP